MSAQAPSSKKRPTGVSSETIVLSIGGSLIVPDSIDAAFIQSLKRCLLGYTKRGVRFVVVCGGGRVARDYQQSASRLAAVTQKDLDWIGIQATFLNAQLIKTVLGKKVTNPDIVTDLSEAPRFMRGRSIIVAGGWKPGCSTDTDAVIAAELLGAKKVVNLSNIDYVYTKDPNKYSDAESIKEITWKRYRAMIPKGWDAGLSSPFDPIASKLAEKGGMEVAIINGKKLAQFEHYLNNRSFRGTVIRP